jgi:inosine-uridine nucleoside N-ribohydrolase
VVGIFCVHNNIAYRVSTAKSLLNILDCAVPIAGEDHADFLQDILKKYSTDLVILSLAPNTQLYKDMQMFPSLFAAIKRIYFQGQIKIDDTLVSPDMQSYNFKQDQEAIQ